MRGMTHNQSIRDDLLRIKLAAYGYVVTELDAHRLVGETLSTFIRVVNAFGPPRIAIQVMAAILNHFLKYDLSQLSTSVSRSVISKCHGNVAINATVFGRKVVRRCEARRK